MIKNSESSYGAVSKVVHWVIALCIIFLIWLGWWMVDLSFYSSWYYTAPKLHKALGIVVFLLAAAKLVWHTVSPPPGLQKELSGLEKAGAKIAHFLLLASMFVIPVTGYLQTTVKGEGVSMFGLFDLPALYRSSESLRDLAIDVHYYFSYILVAVIAAHAGAALKHQFIDKKQTLRRII